MYNGNGLDLLGLCMLVIFILTLVAMFWVYRDTGKRGKTGCFWLLIISATGPLGFIAYLVLRDREVKPLDAKVKRLDAIEARQKRAVFVPFVPYGAQQEIRFPQLCVYCLAPPSAVKDLTISSEVMEQTGKRWWIRHYQVTIRDIPYCAEHAQQSAHTAHIEKTKDRVTRIRAGVAWAVTLLLTLVVAVALVIWEGAPMGSIGEVGKGLLALVLILVSAYTVLRIAKEIKPLIVLGLQEGDMLGISGTSTRPQSITLVFKHPEYARMFAETNGLEVRATWDTAG